MTLRLVIGSTKKAVMSTERRKYKRLNMLFLLLRLPRAPHRRQPMTLKNPINASAVAPMLGAILASSRRAGRCVARNNVWNPQTKKPAVSRM